MEIDSQTGLVLEGGGMRAIFRDIQLKANLLFANIIEIS